MKVLVLSNGNFIQKEIENSLEALQSEVGGYIEIPFLSEKMHNQNIDMIINEEGKMIDGLSAEIAVVNNGKIVDVVFGNIVFASTDDEGDTIGLTDEQIEFVKEELKHSVMIGSEKHIGVVKVLYI
jgi:hypothetical protein